MRYCYVIQYNGKVSSECYTTLSKAIDFVTCRSGSPKEVEHLVYKDINNNTYLIHVLNIK